MSAKEMYQSVMDNIVGQDIFIACAAVSDYSIRVLSPFCHSNDWIDI
jgi:phosphopantothenoylcysteine synthetase/decarboxylase